jgi:PAS domain S-box-containing protein
MSDPVARESGDASAVAVNGVGAKSAARSAAKSAVTTSGAKTIPKSPPIAGIGASAGGREAFTQLLRALPADTGMAFVLVQHLEPSHESMLTKQLARATTMPIHEVCEGMRVEPNHVYVIRANAELSLTDGLLHIAGRKAPARHHLPIDFFLGSLADSLGPRAIGVILSGTAADGTEGLKAIKMKGGITLAQSPESAKFDEMPRCAIAAGCVELILPPEGIASELARIGHHRLVRQTASEAASEGLMTEENWARLLWLLRAASGTDSTSYRKSTINRNLARRMALQKIERIGAYLKFRESGTETDTGPGLEKEADRIVWERYSHAGVLVNDDLEVLHFRGDTSRCIKPVPGKATFNLLRILREELVTEVRAAIKEVRKSGAVARREGIVVSGDHETREVNVEVRPVPSPGARERCFLILFEGAARAHRTRSRHGGKGRARGSMDSEPLRLQDALIRTREYLQAVIGEQESTNEELKRVNDEALSSMEELQTTNQELETVKEELQSSSEEMVALNEQLQKRNLELSRLSDEMSNILYGVDIPIVILDRERRIHRFTPPAQKLLGLLPGDIGRPIAKLRIGVDIPNLRELVSTVVEGSCDIRREVQSKDGRWYLLSLRPFRTGEGKVEGVLMALVDIHELRQNQDALQRERSFISVILDAANDLLVVLLDSEGRIVQFNRAFREVTGYSSEEVKGKRMWDFLAVPEEVAAVTASFKELTDTTTHHHENYWMTKGGARRLIAWADTGVLDENGLVQSVIAIGIDHTDRVEAQERAQESEATLRALLETVVEAIVVVNDEGRITMANAATDKMFGYRRQELLGEPIEKLVPERLRERHVRHRASWFSHPRSRSMGAGQDLGGLRRDGTEFPIEVSLSYLHSRQGLLGVSFISDVTERRKNKVTLLDYQKQLQRLAASLISAQETRNRELARELHDVFSQELAALGMEVSTLLESAAVPSPLKQRLADLGKNVGRLADEIHCTSRQLHPAILEELGLVAALREEFDTFARNSGIPMRFTAAELPVALPEEVSLCLYRIAQETLRNIRKHARATEVRVRLKANQDGATLAFEDIGDGFDVNEARKRGGLGLVSMEERARLVNGKFSIRSQPGNGTVVEVFVPLLVKAE